jgi:hypothetical protein
LKLKYSDGNGLDGSMVPAQAIIQVTIWKIGTTSASFGQCSVVPVVFLQSFDNIRVFLKHSFYL